LVVPWSIAKITWLVEVAGTCSSSSVVATLPCLIAVVPILIAYIFLQRWIVGGLTAGATKG
jgi:raffinose/stachyose/melibiose transport system permease protein